MSKQSARTPTNIKQANNIVEAVSSKKYNKWTIIYVSQSCDIFPTTERLLDPSEGGFVSSTRMFSTKVGAKQYLHTLVASEKYDTLDHRCFRIVRVGYVL